MNKLFWIYDDCLQSQLRLEPASLLAAVGQQRKAPAFPRKVKRSKKSMAVFLMQDLTAGRWGKAPFGADPRSSIPKVSALAAVLPKAEMFDLGTPTQLPVLRKENEESLTNRAVPK